MKKLFLVLPLLALPLRADLIDSFNGISLDTSKWTASEPFSDSSVSVSGGNLILDNRGRVVTQESYSGTVDLVMAFQLTGSAHDVFKILMRTDGVSTNAPGEFDDGLYTEFAVQGDTGSTTNNIKMGGLTGHMALGTYAFSLNTTYLIRLLDDGTNLTLYINDLINPFLSISTDERGGNQVGFYNREGAGAGSGISAGSEVKVDFVSISGGSRVPDSGSTLALLGVGMLGLVIISKCPRSCLS